MKKVGSENLRVFDAPGRTAFLDGLRGLAALYVLIHHAFLILQEGYTKGYALHPHVYSWFDKGMLVVGRFFRSGHEAVFFFFVLSGFVIHLRYARRIVRGSADAYDGVAIRFDWVDYVRRRAVRLYPPLLVALVLTFLLDRWGVSLGYAVYRGATTYDVVNNFAPDHRPTTLLGNLAFVMQTYVPVWGSNGPLWSLKYEWWFYMLYPAILFVHCRAPLLATIGLLLASILAWKTDLIPLRLLDDVLSLMSIWWIGILLADAYVGRPGSLSLRWVRWLGVGLPLLLVLAVIGRPTPTVLWAVAFAGVIAAGLTIDPSRSRVMRSLERLSPLGAMSYSLYVCHMPVLVLLCGYAMSRQAEGALPQHFGWVGLGVVVALLVGYLAHWIGERPFVRTDHRASSADSSPLQQRLSAIDPDRRAGDVA